MSNVGPERRISRRQRSLKPYEREQRKSESEKSTLSTIFKSLSFLNPFRSRSGKKEQQQLSESGSEAESDAEPENPYIPPPEALHLSRRGEEITKTAAITEPLLYPKIPAPFKAPATVNSSPFFSSSPAHAGPSRNQHSPKPPVTAGSSKSFHTSEVSSNVPQTPSNLQSVVDFIRKKGSEPLNYYEVLGITRELCNNSDSANKEIMDFLESASNIPSAALLSRVRSPASNSASASISRPLLAQPFGIPIASRRRHRQTYLGHGFSTQAKGKPRPATSPRPSLFSDETPDRKKRRVGEFGAPETSSTITTDASSSTPTSDTASSNGNVKETPTTTTTAITSSFSRTPITPAKASQPPLAKSRLSAFTAPVVRPSPLRQATSLASDSPPKMNKGRKSQASAAILDVLNKVPASPAPLPPKPVPELVNPYDTGLPSRLRTPAPKPLFRIPLKSSSKESLASSTSGQKNLKRGIDSDNLLDQIDATAPKRPSPTKKSRIDDSTPTATNDIHVRPAFLPSPSETEVSQSLGDSKRPVVRSSASEKEVAQTLDIGKRPSFAPSPSETEVAQAVGTGKLRIPSSGSKIPKARKTSVHYPPPPAKAVKPTGPEADEEDDDVVMEIPQFGTTKSSSYKSSQHGREQSMHRAQDIDEVQVEDMDTTEPSSNVKYARASSVDEPDDTAATSSKGSATSPTKSTNSAPARASSRPPPLAHSQAAYLKSSSPVFPSPLRHVSLPPSESSEEEEKKENRKKESDQMNAEKTAEKPVQLFARGEKERPAFVFKAPAPVPIKTTPKIESTPAPSQVAAPSTTPSSQPKSPKSTPLTFIFKFTGVVSAPTPASLSKYPHIQHAAAKGKANDVSTEKLPSYKFIFNGPEQTEGAGMSKPTTTLAINGGATSGGFNWAGAGFKAPGANASADQWTCELCSCKSPASAEKCTVCEAPKPGGGAKAKEATPAPATGSSGESKSGGGSGSGGSGGFNWAAAGMKVPGSGGGGSQWKCELCECMSPASAEKCTVCEAPKPGGGAGEAKKESAAPASGGSGGFNWGAAGMKAPSAVGGGRWTCQSCFLLNQPGDVCEFCEAKR